MNVLIACEFTGIVRQAFAQRGHNAWSCDLLPTELPGPHIQDNVAYHLGPCRANDYTHWDMVIAHPPCTRLTNAVIWYIKKNNLWGEVREAAQFFKMILDCPAHRICIENPVQHGYVRKPNEYNDTLLPGQTHSIQPYNFGEDASKRTCLWLKNLPRLQKTEYFPPRMVNGKKRWGNQTDGGWNKLPPSDTRGQDRSRTYPGIAKAMAQQWGSLLF